MEKSAYNFVLDCSVTMAWCFEDEKDAVTEEILDNMASSKAVVPTIWPMEVANVLLLASRKGRITSLQVTSFTEALSLLSITIDTTTSQRALQSVYHIAEKAKITIYDATYLELAIREKIPLATKDKDLQRAARSLKVPLID